MSRPHAGWWNAGTYMAQARALMRAVHRVKDDGSWVPDLIAVMRAKRPAERAETKRAALLLADDHERRAAFLAALRLDTSTTCAPTRSLIRSWVSAPAPVLTPEERTRRRKDGARRAAKKREENARTKLAHWEAVRVRAERAIVRWAKAVRRYDARATEREDAPATPGRPPRASRPPVRPGAS